MADTVCTLGQITVAVGNQWFRFTVVADFDLVVTGDHRLPASTYFDICRLVQLYVGLGLSAGTVSYPSCCLVTYD